MPTPSACGAGLALVIIDNKIGETLEVYLAGPEPAFVLSTTARRATCAWRRANTATTSPTGRNTIRET